VNTNLRPFRFGISGSGWPALAAPGDVPVDQRAYLRDEAQSNEAAGFDVMTFADHVMPDMRPALATVLCAADTTTTMRFGNMVLNNDFWNPILLAREVATIHALTGGRIELGIGAGHAKPDYDAVGLKYDPPKVRVDRLTEAVPLIRALLDGETVTHSGTHYSCVNMSTGVPNSPGTGQVPLLIGGNGERVLKLGGKYADIVGVTALTRNINFGHLHQSDWTDDYLDGRIDIVRSAAGSRFADIELNGLIQRVVQTDDREAAAHEFCSLLAPLGLHLPLQNAMTTPFLMFGTIAEMAEQLRVTRERFGISYFTTRRDSVDIMAKVIDAIRA
jgi:probable F420-dependent oxidoreductase